MLHSFGSGTDGGNPRAGLIFDAAKSNLYGTTPAGGTHTFGTVFELSPNGSGGWTERVLYSFCSQTSCTDGETPQAGLIFDAAGNLYSTTYQGGTYSGGTAFELSPQAGGGWTEQVLHSFGNGVEGIYPYASLVFDTAGNLYGTTYTGGENNGTVFELTPTTGGGWTEQTLTNFLGSYGLYLSAGLIIDVADNLYGTTPEGGSSRNCGTTACGTVFELSPNGSGGWTEQSLHNFDNNGTDGAHPYDSLKFDSAGNLYGTTYAGGSYGVGMVFELTPQAGGGWTENVLHSFISNGTDGAYPYAGLIFDTVGNLYGTTYYGGTYGGGTVFELTRQLVATTTALTTAPNPSNLGQAVTMTATVTAQNGSLPTGIVVFESNSVEIGSVSLNSSGVAVLIYAGLSVGTDNLTAVYQGSGTLASSTSNTVMQVVVMPGSSTTSVTSSPNPSTFGGQVTITATVSPSGPPAPTGTVSFTSNGSAISGCTALPLTSSLTAVCMTSTLAVGTDAIVATYSGDGNYSGSSGTLAQLVNPIPSPLQFVAVTPCRLVDTRPDRGGSGPIPGGTFQNFPIPQEGGCNIPTSAAAYSLNVTVVPQGQLAYLTIWPTGQGQPVVSTLNSLDGRIKADAAIVPAGDQGAVSVYVTNTTNVVLDINGYFAPVSGSTLAFYPLTPCRVADTRNSTYPPGLGPPYLTGGQERAFPILTATSCNIPSSAEAYSLNFSVVPHGGLGYLTVWPTGESRPTVSTLNDLPGTIIANAAIVPAGTSGEVSVYPSSDTDLVIDINGYFAPTGPGGLSLYPTAPCRVIDTRHVGSGQPFSGTLSPPVNVVGSQCEPPAAAQAYVFNATVVPQGALGYLTLWPDGESKPLVSTLNALDGSITNNMAIVPSTNGKVDAYASGLTQLILDISSYFAP